MYPLNQSDSQAGAWFYLSERRQYARCYHGAGTKSSLERQGTSSLLVRWLAQYLGLMGIAAMKLYVLVSTDGPKTLSDWMAVVWETLNRTWPITANLQLVTVVLDC